MFRVMRRAGFLVSIAILIFASTKGFAADAPILPAQIALYQGADREKIILEGAGKEGQLVFYNSHTWFNTNIVSASEAPKGLKISLTPSGKARWPFLAPQCSPAGSARLWI